MLYYQKIRFRYLSVWWGLVVRRTYKQILWPLCLEKLTLLLTLISSWENMWRVQCIFLLFIFLPSTYMYNLPYFPISTFSDIWVFSYRERSPECSIQGSLVLVNLCTRTTYMFNCVFIDKRIFFPILMNKFIKLQHYCDVLMSSMWGLGTWSQ